MVRASSSRAKRSPQEMSCRPLSAGSGTRTMRRSKCITTQRKIRPRCFAPSACITRRTDFVAKRASKGPLTLAQHVRADLVAQFRRAFVSFGGDGFVHLSLHLLEFCERLFGAHFLQPLAEKGQLRALR